MLVFCCTWKKVAGIKDKILIHFKSRRLQLALIMFVPLGLVMDLVHEGGHVLWGALMGGELSYMKVAFFELYPKFALTSNFELGYVSMSGLNTPFENGLFLLGGSLTTMIWAWIICPILMLRRWGSKWRLLLLELGMLGLLDMPLYVFLPQIGLKHWFLIGGSIPEPLVGIRQMGIPDTVFYLGLFASTAALAFFYWLIIKRKHPFY